MEPMHSITEAERRVMEAVWQAQPASSRGIIERVQQDTDWHGKTIQTLIGRLVDKRILRRERDGRRFLYSAGITRAEFVRQRSRTFVDTYFKGRVAPLVAAFARSETISRDDLRELEALVGEIKGGDHE